MHCHREGPPFGSATHSFCIAAKPTALMASVRDDGYITIVNGTNQPYLKFDIYFAVSVLSSFHKCGMVENSGISIPEKTMK